MSMPCIREPVKLSRQRSRPKSQLMRERPAFAAMFAVLGVLLHPVSDYVPIDLYHL